MLYNRRESCHTDTVEMIRDEDRKNLINDQMKYINEADKFYFDNENKNSLFTYANMVQKYNEKNNK